MEHTSINWLQAAELVKRYIPEFNDPQGMLTVSLPLANFFKVDSTIVRKMFFELRDTGHLRDCKDPEEEKIRQKVCRGVAKLLSPYGEFLVKMRRAAKRN